MQPKIQLVTDPKKAKALASETRIKILQDIATRPQSISQIARTLKITPVAVLYHIKKLEAAGFIKLASTKVVNNNLTEKFYEVTTSSYLVALSTEDLPVRGPVPPKKQATKQILGVGEPEVEKLFSILGLTYSAEAKAQVFKDTIALLEAAIEEAGVAYRDILGQMNLKLAPTDRLKIEYGAQAAIPITLDRLLDKPESLQKFRSIIRSVHHQNEN
ncbi:MAG: winged helix-turn-helix domain-containing protein [Candidatus Bathyarchaeota archaeon]|nr:winged helix-turn-helix domain-containing protein [Candidatus Bathyarchaeota archaeon]